MSPLPNPGPARSLLVFVGSETKGLTFEAQIGTVDENNESIDWGRSKQGKSPLTLDSLSMATNYRFGSLAG